MKTEFPDIMSIKNRIEKGERIAEYSLKNLSRIQRAFEEDELKKKQLPTLYLYLRVLEGRMKCLCCFPKELETLARMVKKEASLKIASSQEIMKSQIILESDELFEYLKICISVLFTTKLTVENLLDDEILKDEEKELIIAAKKLIVKALVLRSRKLEVSVGEEFRFMYTLYGLVGEEEEFGEEISSRTSSLLKEINSKK